MLDGDEKGWSKNLRKCDKDQIVLARILGQSVSETARLVLFSRSAVPTDSGLRWHKPLIINWVLGAQMLLCTNVETKSVPATYLNIIADHVHPFMAMVFPDGSGLSAKKKEKEKHLCTLHTLFRNGLRNMFPWPQNSPDLNTIEHLWDVLDRQVRFTAAPLYNLQNLNDHLLMFWCNISQDTLRSLVKALVGLTSRHTEEDQQPVRQVDMML